MTPETREQLLLGGLGIAAVLLTLAFCVAYWTIWSARP